MLPGRKRRDRELRKVLRAEIAADPGVFGLELMERTGAGWHRTHRVLDRMIADGEIVRCSTLLQGDLFPQVAYRLSRAS